MVPGAVGLEEGRCLGSVAEAQLGQVPCWCSLVGKTPEQNLGMEQHGGGWCC